MMTFAISLFAVTYLALLVFPKYRAYIALVSAGIFVVSGILPFGEVLGAVDWNVIMMIAGTMGIVSLFIESKMPALLADLIIEKMPNVKWAIIALALFAGIISAFIDNVATVLMVAPVAITISRKLKISPVNSIIAIAISSNLQGAATLVGDTTSILLGGHADMNFLDFFAYKGRPGMFWVVQAGAFVSLFALMFLFRKEKENISNVDRAVVKDYFPTVLLSGTVLLLILASLAPKDRMPPVVQDHVNGLICMTLLASGLAYDVLKNRSRKAVERVLLEIDYFTLLLLAGLFIVIAGITKAGVVEEISKLFVRVSGNDVFVIFSLIVWASVILSAFIDNIPYVATMLPVAGSIAAQLGMDPTLLYFGLLTGATLGGNLTPIGASANIAGLGILRKEGYEVKATHFMKISIPFTLAAVTTGYILIWLIWA
ncbi:MAG: arsenic transporter [Treponema sp. GWB1_62_6]|nr:MAG: arsenic transporter [Treponema sp. GWC1_61_84]OHE67908.1 MAG: arsenic transporter [Treponema sp. GWB1_62_6]HCM25592.1 arsenic transporter [Treponema sp.]